MKIGILGAMEREVKSLYEQLEGMAVKEIGKVKYYCGTLCGKEVVVVKCGVGKVSAAVGAQNLINHFGITHLINSGIAGAMGEGLGVFDFVVSGKYINKRYGNPCFTCSCCHHQKTSAVLGVKPFTDFSDSYLLIRPACYFITD